MTSAGVAATSILDVPTGTPCTASASCTSSDPTLYLVYGSSGDTSSCFFSYEISWGDGSGETTSIHGGPPGAYIVAEHRYTATGSYTVVVKGKVVSGNCTTTSTTATFTLTQSGPTTGQQGGAQNKLQQQTTCSSARPVNCATGAFWHTFTDLSLPGRGVPLEFSRTYSSSRAESSGSLGYGWTESYEMSLSFDANGNATVAEGNGTTAFFYFGGGQYVPAAGTLARLALNPSGTYTLTANDSQVRYVFDSAGKLTEEQDRNGVATVLTYGTGGKLTQVDAPGGRTLTLAYESGRLVSVTDPLGRKMSYAYDSNGNLTKATDAMGRAWTFTYDPAHRLLSMTDPKGGATTNEYDVDARVTKQTDAMGRVTTWSYAGEPASAAGGVTTITDPRGTVTEEHYANLELVSVTLGAGTPQAATTDYAYDLATFGVTEETDPLGNVTTNTYDASGDLLARTDPLGHVSTYTYDGAGDLLTATDPRGTTTSYRYDEAGNLLEEETPDVQSGEIVRTTFQYEGAPGEVTGITDPNGNTTTIAYDLAGDPIKVTDPAGGELTATYDADGERLSATAPAGNEPGAKASEFTSTFSYDAAGELVSRTNALGQKTAYGYDSNGNRTSLTDPAGRTSSFVYNADDELVKQVRADGTTRESKVDAAGNVVAQVDGAGHVTTYSYDPLNRLASVGDPLGRTTAYTYDRAGRRLTETAADGGVTSFAYDEGGRLTAIDYSDGSTPDVTEGYDADGNRVSLVDGTGVSTFSYDSLNRLTERVNGAGAAVGYSYDPAGNVTEIRYPNGHAVTRTFDVDGRLASVTDWLGQTTHFGFNADSALTEVLFGNGVSATMAYDPVDRIRDVTDREGAVQLARFSYTRDALGQVSGETFDNGSTGARAFTRNALNQLTGANAAHYGYDAADNPTMLGGTDQQFDAANELTAATAPGVPGEEAQEEGASDGGGGNAVPPPPTPTPLPKKHCRRGTKKKRVHGKVKCVKKKHRRHREHGARHRGAGALRAAAVDSTPVRAPLPRWLTTATSSSAAQTTLAFGYNQRGDRTSELLAEGGSRSLGYDQADRLTSVGAGISYAYDGDGLRASKTVAGVTTAETWGQASQMPELLQSGTTSYVYGPNGLPVEQIAGGEATFIHSDQQGSTRLLTDEAGAVVGRYDYDPWGKVTSHTGSAVSDLLFDGQVTDAETGFQYLRERLYDPATAQFVQVDPLSFMTRDRYAYALDNPVDNADPSGLAGTLHGTLEVVGDSAKGIGLLQWANACLNGTERDCGDESMWLGVDTFFEGLGVLAGGAAAPVIGLFAFPVHFAVAATDPEERAREEMLNAGRLPESLRDLQKRICTASDPYGGMQLSYGWVDPHRAVVRAAPTW